MIVDILLTSYINIEFYQSKLFVLKEFIIQLYIYIESDTRECSRRWKREEQTTMGRSNRLHDQVLN